MMTNANMKNGLRDYLVGPLGIRTDKGLKIATADNCRVLCRRGMRGQLVVCPETVFVDTIE